MKTVALGTCKSGTLSDEKHAVYMKLSKLSANFSMLGMSAQDTMKVGGESKLMSAGLLAYRAYVIARFELLLAKFEALVAQAQKLTDQSLDAAPTLKDTTDCRFSNESWWDDMQDNITALEQAINSVQDALNS